MNIIRPANFADIPKLHILIEQLGYPQDLKEFAESFKKCLNTNFYHCLVLECRQEKIIKGACIFLIYPKFYKKSYSCFLEVLVVHESYRKQGIGTKLIQELELIAKEKKCSSISLLSNKGRANEVHNFYRDRGYRNEGLRAQLYLRKEIIRP